MKCVLVLAVVLLGSVLSEGHVKNHVHNIQEMFLATMNHYYGEEGTRMLLKRGIDEVNERMKNFERAVEIVEDNNDNPDTQYTSQLNQMSVLTNKEKKNMLNLDPTRLRNATTQAAQVRRIKREDVPDSVCWLTRKGQVPVKNQGSCGSCWAFGAVSALEGNYYILTGDLISFSEQEYVDCTMEHFYEKYKSDWAEDYSGCSGAWMDWAYDYTKTVQRMASTDDYPYKAEDRDCSTALGDTANSFTKAQLTGVDMSMRGSDEKLKAAASQGLVTVAILANTEFMQYRQGIFSCTTTKTTTCDCSGTINHAVTLVGYTGEYWNVRNSWGSNWGVGGYIKMSRAQDNICSINKYAETPVLKCREGQKCPGWEEGFDPDDEEEEEEEEEEGEFDFGDFVKCGEIKHFGNLCVDIDDTAEMNAVLSTAGCSEEFCLTTKGYIRDSATGKCLTSSDPGEDNDYVHFGACQSAETWTETGRGFKINDSGKCWHPNGGSPNPQEFANVVIYSGCDADKNEFKIVPNMCWEEIANSKLGKKIMASNGKPQGSKKFDKAKMMCEEDERCEGLHFNSKKYRMCSSAKLMAAPKNHKAIVMKPCEESCDAGLDRCSDGECRESCSDGEDGDNDGCNAGTTRCPDGVCRHEHMC